MAESSDANATLTSLTGLSIGARIQVLWKITLDGDDGQSDEELKWWEAEVMEARSHPSTWSSGPEWTLRYSEYGDFGKEDVPVTFVSNHELVDDDRDEHMMWRVLGDDWDGDDDADVTNGATMDTVFAGDRVFTSTELQSVVDGNLRELTGMSTDAEMVQEVQNNVPAEDLLRGAAGFRTFIDKFKEHINAVASEQGSAGVVVTPEMVEEFKRTLARG